MAALARTGREAAESSGGVRIVGWDAGTIEAWTRANFRYRDETVEVVRTPDYMMGQYFREGFFEGDCDDVAVMVCYLASFCGLPCRLVAIRYTPDSPEFEHVFAEVWGSDGWRIIDPTVEPGTVMHYIDLMVEDV